MGVELGLSPPKGRIRIECVWEKGAEENFAWGVKLTTHLQLMPKSRLRGAIHPVPQYVFMM